MNSIRIIDKHTIKFFKPVWSPQEIFLARCLEMTHKGGFVYADIRVTWKRSIGGFIRKVFPTLCVSNPQMIKDTFKVLSKMYKDDMESFKVTYAKRLDYSHVGKELRNYQIEGIYRLAHSKYKLLAYEMGCGKTLTSATVSKVLRLNRTAIICPSIAKWNWYEDMCHEWGYNETAWSILEPKHRKSMTAVTERFVVINYEMVGKYLPKFKGREINHFICDENHMLKNISTKKWKETNKLFQMYPKAKRTLMSGTPWTNRVTDLYAYFKICGHPLGEMTKKEFQDTYALMNGNKVVGVKNAEDLKLKMSNFMIRLKSDDVLELPKLTISKAYFDIGALKNEYNDVLREMDKMREEYENMSDDDENKKAFKFAAKVRQSISSLSRITTMSKIPDVVKWVKDLNEQGEKVVIFSSWRSVLEELEKKLDGTTVRVDGSVPPNKRQIAVNKFKDDSNITTFLGQVKAAGVAINLINARIVIMMDIPISPDLIEQPIKRCHRSGQTRPVNAFFTFAKGTVDERLYSLITEKAGDINAIIDADTKKGVVHYDNIPEQLFNELKNKQL